MEAHSVPNPLPFRRRHPARLPPHERHNRPVVLFVTLALREGGRGLDCAPVRDVLVSAWQRASHWIVGYYLVMSEHVHLFCAPAQRPFEDVRTWCGYWKRLAGESSAELVGAWLDGCWDTQMRDREHYSRKLEYTAENPVRRGLVRCSSERPWQGHVNRIPWIL